MSALTSRTNSVVLPGPIEIPGGGRSFTIEGDFTSLLTDAGIETEPFSTVPPRIGLFAAGSERTAENGMNQRGSRRDDPSPAAVEMSEEISAQRELEVLAVAINSIDTSFLTLFNGAKVEVLKLLRDDKFPRWKITPAFYGFISSVKPYEREGNSGSGDSRHIGVDYDQLLDSDSLA